MQTEQARKCAVHRRQKSWSAVQVHNQSACADAPTQPARQAHLVVPVDEVYHMLYLQCTRRDAGLLGHCK